MPRWTWEIYGEYASELERIEGELETRLSQVTNGRVAPALDDLAIGSARHMRAAVLFFDIRGFTQRTGSADVESLRSSLFMLNCVIPLMMRVLYRYGAWVEKNTGDGLMAIIGAETSDAEAANAAIDSAAEMLYVLRHIVNPMLARHGIPDVHARVGIDLGPLFIARIGLPTGTSKHDRNTLTAVGPAANLACKIQGMAGTDDIWCGDLVRRSAGGWRQKFFVEKTPLDWPWEYVGSGTRYAVWDYDAVRKDPMA